MSAASQVNYRYIFHFFAYKNLNFMAIILAISVKQYIKTQKFVRPVAYTCFCFFAHENHSIRVAIAVANMLPIRY